MSGTGITAGGSSEVVAVLKEIAGKINEKPTKK